MTVAAVATLTVVAAFKAVMEAAAARATAGTFVVKHPSGALPGAGAEFDLLNDRASLVVHPKPKISGEIIVIRVGNGTGKGAKAAAEARRKASLR
jgi:hypothetical protein